MKSNILTCKFALNSLSVAVLAYDAYQRLNSKESSSKETNLASKVAVSMIRALAYGNACRKLAGLATQYALEHNFLNSLSVAVLAYDAYQRLNSKESSSKETNLASKVAVSMIRALAYGNACGKLADWLRNMPWSITLKD